MLGLRPSTLCNHLESYRRQSVYFMTSHRPSTFWCHLPTLWWHTKWSQYFMLKVLHSAVTQSVFSLQAWGLGCLHYDATLSVYFLMPSEGRQSVYFLMACVCLKQSLVFLVMSSGHVYLLQSYQVSTFWSLPILSYTYENICWLSKVNFLLEMEEAVNGWTDRRSCQNCNLDD